MKLAWGAKVSDVFRRKAITIAVQHGLDPSDLMAAMAFETGKTFSPSVKNPRSGATGLIQFMPSTARGMGTTTDALAQKTAEDQLDDVEQYLRPFLGRLRTLEDLYMSILWPAAVGKPNDYVLFEEGGSAYAQNRELDIDGDQKITKAEATKFVRMRLEEGLRAPNVFDVDDTQPAAPIEDRGTELPSTYGRSAMDPLSLVGMLVSVFSPLIRAKADKALGSDVGKPLVDNLLGMTQTLTGRADPMEAVAVARRDPAIVAKLEAATEDWFAKVAPMLDKLAQYDRDVWSAQREGRISASTVAIAEKTAGIWDMTRTLVVLTGAVLAVISFGLLAAILVQAMTEKRTIDGALIGLAGPIWTATLMAWAAIIAFRFDGTKESEARSAAVNALNNAPGRVS